MIALSHASFPRATARYRYPDRPPPADSGRGVTSVSAHEREGRAPIGKGAHIPSGSVVWANSFVNKAFDEENTIIAGAPATVVRRNVVWDRGRAEALE